MSTLRWLWNHWYLPLLAVGLILVGILRATWTAPRDGIKGELDAIDAGERARLQAITSGVAAANAKADLEYERTINAINLDQRAKAGRMRGNPGRRVRYLNRLNRKLRDRENSG